MISSIWAHNLFAYSLQVALLVGTGALLHRFFRPRSSPATLAYWQTLLLGCLLLPLCQPWKTSATVLLTANATVLSTAEGAVVTSANLSPTTRSSAWPIQQTLLVALLAGIVGRACWLVIGSVSLFRLRRRSLPLASARPFTEVQEKLGIRAVFYASDRITSPITFGLLRPVIILPHRVLEMERPIQEAIAYHELIHVRRRDWIFEVIEEGVRALLWFHPAICWLIGRIQLSREQVVDRAVIHLTQSREQYLDALLTVALAKSQPQIIPAPLFLRRRLLKQRVAEILKEYSMSKLRLSICLAAISCLVLMAAAAAVRIFPLEVRAQGSGSEPVQVVRGGEHLLHGDRFEYPRRAIERRIAGDVELEVSINEQGHVYDARVLSGPEELRKAALESALQWHYSPAMGVPTRTQATVRFKLPSEDANSEVTFKSEDRGLLVGKDIEVVIDDLEPQVVSLSVNLDIAQKISEVKQELSSEKVKDEVRVIKLVQSERLFDGTRRLSRIRTEGVSDSTLRLLLPRLGIRVGDLVSKESVERIKQSVQEFDEHFRISFHAADDGGVIMVILAP